MSIEIKNLDTNKPLKKSCIFAENLLIASLIACHSGISTIELGLIIKKKNCQKPPYIFLTLFLLFGSILKNVQSNIFILGNSKCVIICK